nr:hypothetical protein CFP56_04978 [Quercus suber]
MIGHSPPYPVGIPLRIDAFPIQALEVKPTFSPIDHDERGKWTDSRLDLARKGLIKAHYLPALSINSPRSPMGSRFHINLRLLGKNWGVAGRNGIREVRLITSNKFAKLPGLSTRRVIQRDGSAHFKGKLESGLCLAEGGRRSEERVGYKVGHLGTDGRDLALREGTDRTITALAFMPASTSLAAYFVPGADSTPKMVGQLKGCLPTIMNRYLPRLSKIPLCQGMSWTSTWKSLPTYKQMTECLRQEVEGAVRFVRHGLQSPFPALMFELLAYSWFMERIHVIEEYQSTGLLWPQRVRFSEDRNNKRFSGIDQDTFERTIGPFHPSIRQLGVDWPAVSGRLGQSVEGGGKRRIFSIGRVLVQEAREIR